MRRRYRSSAAVAAAVILLAGCGGSSSSDRTAGFKAGFDPVVSRFQQIAHSIAVAIEQASSQTDAQLATTFRQLAGQWQDQLSRLETLKPPSSLAVVFNTFTGAVSRAESDLTAIVSAALTHSKSAATQAGASLVRDLLAAKSAAVTILHRLGTG